MNYIGFEIRKIIGTPLVRIALAVVIVLDIVSVLMGGNQPNYIVVSPDFRTNLDALKEQRTHFAGAITQDWIDLRRQESETILHDPQYRVSEEEAERIVETQMRKYGYTEERVRERLVLGAVLLLFPMIDFAFTNIRAVNLLYNFFPTRMMMGMKIWQGYGLFYAAGYTFPCPYAAVAFAAVVSAAVCPLTKRLFTRRQIGN